uniref:Peptidase M14 carboxypeptidase A domain-containing protein n=1 Tax=Podarcis muralis TaxID=64176 RepID=A0A670JV41_PODMU
MGTLSLVLLLPLVAALDFNYHHTKELEAFLKAVQRDHSNIAHLYSIGKSVQVGSYAPSIMHSWTKGET